jgi:hypothetical protein
MNRESLDNSPFVPQPVERLSSLPERRQTMAKTFTVEIPGDPKALVQKAESAARASGADFSGDENAGRFSGSGVEGHYERAGSTLTITIDKAPFYATWAMIEAKIRGFFA